MPRWISTTSRTSLLSSMWVYTIVSALSFPYDLVLHDVWQIFWEHRSAVPEISPKIPCLKKASWSEWVTLSPMSLSVCRCRLPPLLRPGDAGLPVQAVAGSGESEHGAAAASGGRVRTEPGSRQRHSAAGELQQLLDAPALHLPASRRGPGVGCVNNGWGDLIERIGRYEPRHGHIRFCWCLL